MATATASKPLPSGRSQISQLQSFTWVGKDKRGVTIKGETLGKNVNLVKADLRKQGINPQVVKAKAKPLFGSSGKTIKGRDIAVFSRQLATMMAAGVPMVQGFEIVAGGQSNPRMKDMLTAIKTDIEGGSALHEALGKFPVQFDELFVNLVKAGESAGVLDTVLDTIATYKENIENIKGKIKKAMFYPAAVIAVAILVSALLLIFVIPQFETVFQNFGADLPAFTQMLVNMSRFMVSYWWLVLGIFGGTVTGIIMLYKRSTKFAHFVGRMMLKIPIIGVLMGKEIAQMDDYALRARVETTNLFCRVNPSQKDRVILALKARGHVVGYLGDGINDAPSLHSADVGLSVDSAVDVAKEAADMILLQP